MKRKSPIGKPDQSGSRAANTAQTVEAREDLRLLLNRWLAGERISKRRLDQLCNRVAAGKGGAR